MPYFCIDTNQAQDDESTQALMKKARAWLKENGQLLEQVI